MLNLPLVKLAAVSLTAGLLVSQTTCGGSTSVKTATNQLINWKITPNATWQFLYDPTVQIQYEFFTQGYPNNRVIVQVSWVKTAGSGASLTTTTTPATLIAHKTIPIIVRTGGGAKTLTYTATLVASSDLPAGQYVLNMPGAIEQVQYWLNYYPTSPASIQFSTGNGGAGINGLLPLGQQDTDFASADVSIDLDAALIQSWRTLQTKDPDLDPVGYYTWKTQ